MISGTTTSQLVEPIKLVRVSALFRCAASLYRAVPGLMHKVYWRLPSRKPLPQPWRSVAAIMLLAVFGTATAQTAAPPSHDDVPTLGEVRAMVPDESEPVDLYRFKNPVRVEPNRFDRSYQPPPSVKQVSESGGYLMMGIYYGIVAIARGLHQVTGARDPIQPAIARPSPLTAEQMQRATSLCTVDGHGCRADSVADLAND